MWVSIGQNRAHKGQHRVCKLQGRQKVGGGTPITRAIGVKYFKAGFIYNLLGS